MQIGSDHYLIVSNANHGNRLQPRVADSIIYRWQGVEKFVPTHQMHSLPSADWETFTDDGNTYLVYANAVDNLFQVYRVKLI